eukprot:6214787-Pleurochrysis_carterae.AAC.4
MSRVTTSSQQLKSSQHVISSNRHALHVVDRINEGKIASECILSAQQANKGLHAGVLAWLIQPMLIIQTPKLASNMAGAANSLLSKKPLSASHCNANPTRFPTKLLRAKKAVGLYRKRRGRSLTHKRYDCAHACRAFHVLCGVLRCRSLCFGVLQLERADADSRLVADEKLDAGHLHDEAVDIPGLVCALAHPLDDLMVPDRLQTGLEELLT